MSSSPPVTATSFWTRIFSWNWFTSSKEDTLKTKDAETAGGAAGGSDNFCAICHDELSTQPCVSLACPARHTFHASCIERWLLQDATCPFDRTAIRASDLLPKLSRYDLVRFYAGQYAEGVATGVELYLLAAESFTVPLVTGVIRIILPWASANITRMFLSEFVRDRFSAPLRSWLFATVSLRIECEAMDVMGIEGVYDYMGVVYFSKLFKIATYRLVQLMNYGYNYRLASNTKRTETMAWCVRHAGHVSGVLIYGWTARQLFRRAISAVIGRFGNKSIFLASSGVLALSAEHSFN